MKTNPSSEVLWCVLASRDRALERLRRHCIEMEEQNARELQEAQARADRLQRELNALTQFAPVALGLTRRCYAVARVLLHLGNNIGKYFSDLAAPIARKGPLKWFRRKLFSFRR
jgi:hypothetical protein